MEIFLTAIIGSVSTIALISFVVYLSRNWLMTRLKASIKHEYDVKLENYKSQVSRRQQAYENVIDAIYDMITYFRVHKEDYGQGTGMSDEQEAELSQKYIVAKSTMNRATDIGTLYISDEAGQILSRLRLRERLDCYEEPLFEYFEHEFLEHQKVLDELIEAAKADSNRTN